MNDYDFEFPNKKVMVKLYSGGLAISEQDPKCDIYFNGELVHERIPITTFIDKESIKIFIKENYDIG